MPVSSHSQKRLTGPRRQHFMLRLLRSIGMLLAVSLVIGSPAYAGGPLCQDYEEVRKTGHMSLGVSFDIPDPLIQQQFRHAMNFWASLLDMHWHSDETPGCAIKVSYGVPAAFDSDDIAQADDPDSAAFRGEIVFNAAYPITRRDAFLVCVHEIGHLLGLDHNPNATSVMHAVWLDGSQKLQADDISALAARHQLRGRNNDAHLASFDLPEPAVMDGMPRPPAESVSPST